MRGTVVRENEAGFGGGLYNEAGGTADVIEAAVRDNTVGFDGGGVRNAGTLTLERSLLAGNTATAGVGGGLSNRAGTATLRNSTVSGNRATGAGSAGGGISVEGGTVRAAFVTVAGNRTAGAGGGVLNGATFEAKGLLLADNTAGTGPDCRGPLSSQGSNLIEDPTDCTITGTTTGNLTGDPALAPLGDNGGPTETHALPSSSPAVDAVAAGQCTDLDSTAVGTDQRGVGRPRDGNGNAVSACDIGAFELAQHVLTVTLAGNGSGTVRSAPAGIDCGSDCDAVFPESQVGLVALVAVPAPGSTFAGFSGPADCADGLLTLTANTTCTATFGLVPGPTPTPAPVPGLTRLTAPAAAGTTTLQVESTAGFGVGDWVVIAPESGEPERRQVTGLGSLILDAPLTGSYPTGTYVVLVDALPQCPVCNPGGGTELPSGVGLPATGGGPLGGWTAPAALTLALLSGIAALGLLALRRKAR